MNSFASDERLADSINHLLVVGFYLINLGYVTLALKLGVKPVSTVIVVLSGGGVIGVVGWLRARRGSSSPDGHDVTATLVCLVVGTATALAVGGFAAAPIVVSFQDPWGLDFAAWPALLFAVAHAVWVAAGIGWMQRLTRRYTEHTGRAFDGLPAASLCVAIALAATAALLTLTL